jgi:mono/diheme cytochrome c family protein
MRKLLKWFGFLLGGLVGLALLAFVTVYFITERTINETYSLTISQVPVPDPLPAQESNWPLILADFCKECHGPDFGGSVMENDPMTAVLVAPNLTSGRGGIASSFSDEDWVLALRHGIGHDKKSLIVMPSEFFNHLSDQDLGTLIAYIKTLPPVDRQLPELTIGPIGRFFVLQEPNLLPASIIDHAAPPPADPPAGVNLEHGEYLSFMCSLCHAEDLSGGPNASAGLNLTPAGDLGSWTEAAFIETMRTGVTPEGETLDPIEMPWKDFSKLSDDQLKAIWLYLQSLPPIETHES